MIATIKTGTSTLPDYVELTGRGLIGDSGSKRGVLPIRRSHGLAIVGPACRWQLTLKKASLITDGSCLGNPGPGGWACILRFGAARKELFGFDPDTTNNRMELMAAIQGLLAFKEPCEVEITTDSDYVLRGITLWVRFWKRRHWWKKNRPVRNVDLWMELDELVQIHQTKWIWTKGHADHEDNNKCDRLAQNAARTQTSSFPEGIRHGKLRLDLGRDYLPPKPQADLFETADSALREQEDDESDPG